MVGKRLSFPNYREAYKQKGLKNPNGTVNCTIEDPSRAINKVNSNRGKEDTAKIVENPSYIENSVRKARIVRTNSIEERTLEQTNTRGKPARTIGRTEYEKKVEPFMAKKSSHIETRRSLPAPASLKEHPEQMTPQRRSTTNVRAVETKLSQKQQRKIRRTVEGDEVLEALVLQEKSQPGISTTLLPPETMQAKTEEIKKSDPDEIVEIMPRDSTDREEVFRVQKIVNNWNRTTRGITARHQSTRYVGTHVHPVPDLLQTNAHTHQPSQREQPGRTSGDGIRSVKPDKTRENTGTQVFTNFTLICLTWVVIQVTPEHFIILYFYCIPLILS